MGDQIGEDLWDYAPEHGCGLRKGLDVLMPYLKKGGESEWPHQQIDPISLSHSSDLTLRLFSQHFADPSYAAAVERNNIRHAERDFAALVAGDGRDSGSSSKADENALGPAAK